MSSTPTKKINNVGTLAPSDLVTLLKTLFGDNSSAGLIAGVDITKVNGQIQINPSTGAYSFPTSS